MALLHCAPLLPSRPSFIPTFLPPLSVRGTITLSVLPSSQSGWVMLPPIFSLTISLSLPLSLSHSLTHTHTLTHSWLLPLPSPPPIPPPSCFLPSPPPHLCSLSHLAVYMCMHSKMLPSCTLMHTLRWGVKMRKNGGKGEKKRGRRRGEGGCLCVHVWGGKVVHVGYSWLLLYSCLVT